MPKHPILTKAKSFLPLIAFLLLLPVSCATNTNIPTTNTTVHKTYNYANFIIPAAIDSLSPGSQFQIIWKPKPDLDLSVGTPDQVRINAKLIGPFSSVTDLKEAEKQATCTTSYTNVVASIPTIQTNSWTNKTYTSTLQVPQNLIAGYYELLQIISSNEPSKGCSFTQSFTVVKAKN